MTPKFLKELHKEVSMENDWGKVVNYIPELANVPLKQLGVAICKVDGTLLTVGEADKSFSVQSITKVFTLALALRKFDDKIWKRLSQEPSNASFNSISQLERDNGIPKNPLINAGAIVISDILLDKQSVATTLHEILDFFNLVTGEDIHINPSVASSEAATGNRNKSLAYFLRSYKNLKNLPENALEVYFNQCAIEMNCQQLALAGRFLCQPDQWSHVLSKENIHTINALMMMCGHYNGSGAFAVRVGFPGKSGVGGGILAIVPNVASIAVWSPGLDKFGNSKLGTLALEKIAKSQGWSIF